jgi:hypothetical protein
MKKKIKKVCKNCQLYNPQAGLCSVNVYLGEEKYNMPVFPNDKCHMDELGIEVKEIRFWTEDPKTGEKTGKDGVVKMEYPNDLDLWKGFLD